MICFLKMITIELRDPDDEPKTKTKRKIKILNFEIMQSLIIRRLCLICFVLFVLFPPKPKVFVLRPVGHRGHLHPHPQPAHTYRFFLLFRCSIRGCRRRYFLRMPCISSSTIRDGPTTIHGTATLHRLLCETYPTAS